MTSTHSTKWFWSDWIGDIAVRSLTPAERGLWIDLLSLAAVGNPTGYVCDARGNPLSYEEIARFANCSPTDAESLISGILAKGVASQDRSGRLFNRRMIRDIELVTKRRYAGKLGGAVMALRIRGIDPVTKHMPSHVPKQNGTRATSNKKITSTFTAAARDAASANNAGTESADTPAGLRKRVREELRKSAGSIVSGEFIEINKAKGWVP